MPIREQANMYELCVFGCLWVCVCVYAQECEK